MQAPICHDQLHDDAPPQQAGGASSYQVPVYAGPPPEQADGGSSRVTSDHRRVTNPADAVASQGPDLDLHARPGPTGRPWTVSTTCARWYPVRGPARGPGRLLARQSGIGGSAASSRSSASRSHISQSLTTARYVVPGPMQPTPHCGSSTKILHARLDVPPLGGQDVRVSRPSSQQVVRHAHIGEVGEAGRPSVVQAHLT